MLIVCEDSKSSKNYLEDLCVDFRSNAKVKVSHCGNTDPEGIINYARKNKNKYEKIFCVIDRDEHPSFGKACSEANGLSNVQIVASYPSFEFWLLLHFLLTRKPFVRSGKKSPGDELIRELKKDDVMPNYDKGRSSLYRELKERLNDARSRSLKILEAASREGEMNPSTQLHELVDYIEEMESPKKA
ncbi:RloB family protein [Alcanivorax sp. IL3]|uniref:RloB family protein n=1 Tax=unclassified Alcanivorax TaxID=2638842 RepID=UPI0039C2A18F